MLDPSELYDVVDDVPELGRPVMMETLTGAVDAGGAVRLAGEHLLTILDRSLVAVFDVDQLLDYRARRPAMTFAEDHWEDYHEPVLGLYAVYDSTDAPFLLLDGPEPDLQWRRFTAAVRALVQRLGVRLTVGLDAIPMAVPHTRPCGITAHATRRNLIAGYEPWLRRIRVPSSAGNLLEYELGREGHDAIGFAAHVPHYLSQTDYPLATEMLLTSVSRATGLLLPVEELHAAAEVVRNDIDQQLAQGGEATALVHVLEEQYDALMEGRAESTDHPPTSGSEPLPTGDELGAALERFLAEQAEPGGPPAPS